MAHSRERRPFLDKLVSAPHMPQMRGQAGFCSTHTFPDLSHTAIQTKYCPQIIPSTTPTNRMTALFRNEAFIESLDFERPIAELRHKKEFFKRAHNVFFNKVLVDLEQQKQERLKRREVIWTQGKKKLGFENAFNLEGTPPTLGGFESVAFQDCSYADEVFESETDAKAAQKGEKGSINLSSVPEFTEVCVADEEALLLAKRIEVLCPPCPPGPKRNLTINTEFDFSGPNPGNSSSSSSSLRLISPNSSSKMPGVLLLQESLSRASTASTAFAPASSSGGKDSRSRSRSRGRTAASLTPNRRRRAFSRMTIFECLLDSMPVPDPHAPRYGTLPSPIRVIRRTPPGFSLEPVMGSSPITSSSSVLRAGTASPTQRHQPHVTFSPTGSAATSTATATATATATTRVSTATSSSRNRTPVASKSQAPSLVQDSFASFFDTTPETRGSSALPLETEVVLPPDVQVEATVDLADLEIENQGLQRWTVESVTRCLSGDKPLPPKIYR